MGNGKLYLSRITTPQGNTGHELVAMVSEVAVHKARQDAEDARTRSLWRRVEDANKRLAAERREQHRRLCVAVDAWLADIAKGNKGRGW